MLIYFAATRFFSLFCWGISDINLSDWLRLTWSITSEFQISGWTRTMRVATTTTTKTTWTIKMRRKTRKRQGHGEWNAIFTPLNAIRNPCTGSVCDDPTALQNKAVLSLAQAKLRCKQINHQPISKCKAWL